MSKRVFFTIVLLICAAAALSVKLSWRPHWKVSTAASRIGEVSVNIRAEGRIEEASSTEIYSPIESIVMSTKVSEGEYVKKDAGIVELADGSLLKSPVNGVVRLLTAKAGMPIVSSQPIAVIGDEGRLVAKLNISEDNASKVRQGQRAEITCAAAGGKVYKGVVSFVAPSAKTVVGDRGSRTVVETTVDIENTEGLKTGFTAQAQIIAEQRSNAVMVPFDALAQYNGKTGVWKEKNGYAYFSPVDTGAELELETEIKQGVGGGEKIIVSPPKGMLNGARVEVAR